MATPCFSKGAEALIIVLLLRLSGALYDPVHHIESARIYGNIDAFAYYYVDLLIGTPPQRVSVIVDTGSGVTAFPCRSCRHCGHHIDPNFDFDASSSAAWVGCGGECRQRTCRNGHCSYHQGYTEGSSISGWYFQDLVRLGDAVQKNPPVRSTMGCHQDENKLFYTQKANGIMGIRPPGHGAATILDELFADKAHIDSQVFSLCLAEWGGRMVVGGFNQSYHTGPVQMVPLSMNSGYYHVPLTNMVLAGQSLSMSWGTAMIDSGTTYTYMGRDPYNSLRRGIEQYCDSHGGCGATRRNTCWEAPSGLSGFPDLEVWFQSVKTTWVPKAYLYRKGTGDRWCYSFEDDGPRANTVLGASWMIHQEIIFDLRAGKVGIAQANCPEFKNRPAYDPKEVSAMPVVQPGDVVQAETTVTQVATTTAAATAAGASTSVATTSSNAAATIVAQAVGVPLAQRDRGAPAAKALPESVGTPVGSYAVGATQPSIRGAGPAVPPQLPSGDEALADGPLASPGLALAGALVALALAAFFVAGLVAAGRRGGGSGQANGSSPGCARHLDVDDPKPKVPAEVVGHTVANGHPLEEPHSGEEDPLVAAAGS